MLNLLSILVGIVALLIALVGLPPIPLLPLVNWIALPIAVIGIAIGVVSGRSEGRNLNIVVAVVSGLRLWLTWGFI